MTHLVERSFLTQEICSLNPVIGKFYSISTVLKRRKDAGNGPFKKLKHDIEFDRFKNLISPREAKEDDPKAKCLIRSEAIKCSILSTNCDCHL